MATEHSELLDFVRKHGVLRGRFVLSSGRESTYYIDGKMVTFSPEGLRLTVAAIRKELAPYEFDAIGGRDMGATPIAAAYAVLSPTEGRRCDAFTVRKEVKGHGSRKRIEGPLRANAKVAIVDDVVTTGASILDAIEAVQAEGCRVVAAVTLVDRAAGAAEGLARLGDLPPIYVPVAMRVGPRFRSSPGRSSGALRGGRSRGFGGSAPKDRQRPANAAGV